MKTLSVEFTGIRPLIMSNPQTVDIANPYAVESRRLNNALKAARKRADEDRLIEIAASQKRNDFMASAYFDAKKARFFVPDTVVMACVKQAAQSLRKGKDIDRAVLMESTEAYVDEVPRVKSLEDAIKNEVFHLETPCKIPPKTGALFMKLRCVMPTGWKLAFQLTFDSDIIAEKTLREVLTTAGGFVGVGSWRPKFGRFTVATK